MRHVAHIEVHQSDRTDNVTIRTPEGEHVYTDPDEVIANGRDLIARGRQGESRGYFSRIGFVMFDSPRQMIEAGRKMAAVRPRGE